MSSSGLIYAVIVGAWAVYLVPMWLRREDELNRARQTQRYAAAIKVLSNKEAFERRWAKAAEATIELPLAVGQNLVPQATPAPQTPQTKPPARPKTPTASRPAAEPTHPTKRPTPTSASAPTSATPPSPTVTSTNRLGLMARRRRVVTLLFGMSTLGALVTADLGTGYLWAMAMPAALLSVYIVRLRREERARATERARRRALADEARRRAQIQAHTRAKAKAQARAKAEAEAEAKARQEAELEAHERRQAQAAARRRTAAARARAQSFTPQDSAALRRASNG